MRGPIRDSPYRSRRENSDNGKSEERWDTSRTSNYSETSSGGSSGSGWSTGNNRFKIVSPHIRSWFSSSSSSTDPAASCSHRKLSMYGNSNNSTHSTLPGPEEKLFTMADIRKATRNFSPGLKIGQGGFGTVYKGRLEDGTLVAIKRAKKSVYGKHLSVEFQSEVSTLSCIRHLNLVRFYGYVESEGERIIAVEFVPNGTLREHLDGTFGYLNLGTRLDIAIDVCHAVTYLHMYAGKPIIHRDIKSSNILLTENLRAKVTDFGFARIGDTATDVTHITTLLKGTVGYLDPEYIRTCHLTEKSDVYSFGVLLVEMISGRRPVDPKRETNQRLTAKWAMSKLADGQATQVLDPKIPQNATTNMASERILELAMQCLAPIRQERCSMGTCGKILWGIRKVYREMV